MENENSQKKPLQIILTESERAELEAAKERAGHRSLGPFIRLEMLKIARNAD